MSTEETTDPAREVRAERVVQRVREIYELGREALQHLEKNPEDWHALTGFAAERKIGIDTVRKAKRFAEHYTKEETNEFCELRNCFEQPLNWTHAVQLTRVKDRKLRKQLLLRTVQQGWTQTELGLAIMQTGRRRACGGRKLKRPETDLALLEQFAAITEEWNRRYKQVWSVDAPLNAPKEEVNTRELKKTPAKALRAIKRAREAVATMREASKNAEAQLLRLERQLRRGRPQ